MRRSIGRPRAQGGFTLVELMIALVVSSLLVGLILAIFLRMSFAYRSQQEVAGVQQVLAAARGQLELDAKHAGAALSDGFWMADNNLYMPVRIVNNNVGPDEVAFYYADTTVVAAVTGGTKTIADVDSTAGFAPNDIVVMSTPMIVQNPIGVLNEPMSTYVACVLQIETMTANQLTFSQVGPWGRAGEAHCPDAGATSVPFSGPALPGPPPRVLPTKIYKLVSRYYRVDAGRPGEGVLQVSPSGNLVGLADWRDLGVGFTDLQVATRFFENGDAADPDGDGDPSRDWYSSGLQQGLTNPTSPGPFAALPMEMTISLVARTERNVEGIASTATPALTGVPIDYNSTGDHDAVDLTTTVDPTLQGERIYRYTTFRMDLRNLGGGR